MSLKPDPIPPIPLQTQRVAQAAFPRGNVYMQMRDQLGVLYEDTDFADLFPTLGQPADAPWRLALVTVWQFLENLTDRQAADAVRSRIDWKYGLSLELEDEGFDHTVLSEFRTRLVAGNAELRLLDLLLTQGKQHGWVKARGRQRTDSTHVLAKIRALNRLLCVAQTLVAVLAVLAEVAPDWLLTMVEPEWTARYGYRLEHERLPQGEDARQQYANQVGTDGWTLLIALDAPTTPEWLRNLPVIERMRRIWDQQYWPLEAGGQWRDKAHAVPPAQMINSPYDEDARYSMKRSTLWVGYKVHFSETCDAGRPHLITHVATTRAGVSDDRMTRPIHSALQAKDLLPAEHLVDTGYVDAELLITSQQEFGVDLVGPTRKNYQWQAQQQTGFATDDFAIDWERKVARCPEGKLSSSWTPAVDRRTNDVIKIKFATRDCQPCPSRSRCTTAKRHTRRTVTVRPQEQAQALHAARTREATPEFRVAYHQRSGIEGTHSQATRTMGLRRSRYVGLAKTHLQHVATAVAMNLLRLIAWQNDIPLARTRHSPFLLLMQATG
ncbi:MAG: IS1182 family transposase [Ktedonobacterales bacterium]|nr:IS1182 family transposase [Ktedonobacterales bacterium]